MRRVVFLPAIALCLSAILPSLPAHATGGVQGLSACPAYADDHICSGEVVSWDGTPLDVDLTLPEGPGGNRHGLVVMLHGFGNNKHEWESLTDEGDNHDKWHWNTHWFAEHGYYVLTYTARGFLDQGPDRADQPQTPSGTSYTGPGTPGTIHLKSRDYEIKDTQWLAALVAAAYPDLDTNQVAVTGGSYGGGESWLQASQPVWNANTFPATPPNPPLPILHLQVAVPKYPWTDLGYSLAPNGHAGPFDGTIYSSSTGSPTSDTGNGNPVGVIKYSYATGFTFIGISQGFFETTPENIPGWYTDGILAGDPYDAGMPPDRAVYLPELRRGLTELRSAFYQDEFWALERQNREVGIFSISGWTDDLFPPIEAFRQFKYLKSLDPLWPVEVAVANVGHPRALNPAYQWHYLNDQAWGFFKDQIHGSHGRQTDVFSLPTVCPSTDSETGPVQRLTGKTPEDLANGSLTIAYSSSGDLLNRKVGQFVPGLPPPADPDQDNLQTDPAFGAVLLGLPSCRQSVQPAAPPMVRYTALSEPLAVPRTYVGLGYVHVSYAIKTPTATTATINARVWDVAPDGTTFLMTRGTYRIDGNGTAAGYDPWPSGTRDIPLFGNQWTLEPGHSVRLDLTEVDYPTFQPANSQPPGAVGTPEVSFTPPQLVLPTREATELSIGGS